MPFRNEQAVKASAGVPEIFSLPVLDMRYGNPENIFLFQVLN
jgi:hypothetical protein